MIPEDDAGKLMRPYMVRVVELRDREVELVGYAKQKEDEQMEKYAEKS